MTTIHEIAPDVYRISVFVPEINLQFNHFLIKDEQPVLYHTGTRSMFPLVHEALRSLIDPAQLRWISFSHFEVDECGALNEWLQVAPRAQAVCSLVGAMVNINDFAIRPALGLQKGESFTTGKYTFRYLPTPHLPHGWDAGVMFEETHRTLFCSDLFHHDGNVVASTESDILGQVRRSLAGYQAGPLMDYLPYTVRTRKQLYELADLQPQTLAIMHGSSFVGDGARALRDLSQVMKEVLSGEE
jgi:flavorubredoxin